MHEAQSNLFSAFYRWAQRQNENFTTEALFSIIKLLLEKSPHECNKLIAHIYGEGLPEDLVFSDLKLDLQPRTQDAGTPDAKISARDFLIYIEAKVSAPLSKDQREAYEKELRRNQCQYKRLIFLTHFPLEQVYESEIVHNVRWYQIGEYLEEISKNDIKDPIAKHLIKEFIDFLSDRGLAITQVKSPLSKAIKEFRCTPEGETLFSKRIRSIEELEKHEKLEPLVSLLKIMDLAVTSVNPLLKMKFDSGKHGGGWIGYNINSMEYFFALDFSDPDVIYLEAYKRQFVENRWDKTSGEVYGPDNNKRWCNWLDLSKPSLDFFNKSKSDQLAIIRNFLTDSFELARKFSDPVKMTRID